MSNACRGPSGELSEGLTPGTEHTLGQRGHSETLGHMKAHLPFKFSVPFPGSQNNGL